MLKTFIHTLIIACATLLATVVLASCSDKKGSKTDSAVETTQQSSGTPESTDAPKSGAAHAESGATFQQGLPIIIDFYATWCGPCKQIAPLFDELKEEYKGRVNFSRVDVDQDAAMAQKYNITAMPTFVLLDADENEIGRIVGADPNGLRQGVETLGQLSATK